MGFSPHTDSDKPRADAPLAEPFVAAAVFALPLAYLLTERTAEVAVWRWSLGWLTAICVYAAVYWVLLASYRRSQSRAFALARKLAVALCASLVAVLGTLELVLRAIEDPPYEGSANAGRHLFDPDVGHVYVPNYTCVIETNEFTTPWRSNAQGLRADREYGAKPKGVVRVLVVGDSFTVGDQVPVDETYPSVMQQEFDRLLGPGRVEVLNAGFPGYGTIHERKWIEKFACGFEPDLVVVGSTPNDLLENKYPILYVARDGALANPRVTDGERESRAERGRWYSLPGWIGRSRVMHKLEELHFFDRLRGRGGSVHALAFQVEQSHTSREQYKLYERELVAARDAAERCGAKFAVLAIPFLEQLRVPGRNQDFTLWGKRTAEIGARRGFPVVDLFPDFQAAGDPTKLYGREDTHCAAAGYRLIGVGASAGLPALRASTGGAPRER